MDRHDDGKLDRLLRAVSPLVGVVRPAVGAELLYAAAMLHDLGLTSAYEGGGCFESDGAQVAQEILAGLGWPAARQKGAARAIYLHMHGATDEDSVEARLLVLGAAADVTGRNVLDIDAAVRALVLELFPRGLQARDRVSLRGPGST